MEASIEISEDTKVNTTFRCSEEIKSKIAEIANTTNSELRLAIEKSVQDFANVDMHTFRDWIHKLPIDRGTGIRTVLISKLKYLFEGTDKIDFVEETNNMSKIIKSAIYWNHDRLIGNSYTAPASAICLDNSISEIEKRKPEPVENKTKYMILKHFENSYNTRLIGPPSSGKSYYCNNALANKIQSIYRDTVISPLLEDDADVYIINCSVEAGISGTSSSRLILGMSFSNGKHALKKGILLETIIESIRNPGKSYIFVLDDCHNQQIEMLLAPILPVLKSSQRYKNDLTMEFESINKSISGLTKHKGISSVTLLNPMAEGEDFLLSLPDNFFLCLTSNVNENCYYPHEWRDRFHDIRFYPYIEEDSWEGGSQVARKINRLNKIVYNFSIENNLNPLLLMIGEYTFSFGVNLGFVEKMSIVIKTFCGNILLLKRTSFELFNCNDILKIILAEAETSVINSLFERALADNPFVEKIDSLDDYIRIIYND